MSQHTHALVYKQHFYKQHICTLSHTRVFISKTFITNVTNELEAEGMPIRFFIHACFKQQFKQQFYIQLTKME